MPAVRIPPPPPLRPASSPHQTFGTTGFWSYQQTYVAYCGLEKAVPSAASGAISVVVDELLQVILVFAVDTFHPQPR